MLTQITLAPTKWSHWSHIPPSFTQMPVGLSSFSCFHPACLSALMYLANSDVYLKSQHKRQLFSEATFSICQLQADSFKTWNTQNSTYTSIIVTSHQLYFYESFFSSLGSHLLRKEIFVSWFSRSQCLVKHECGIRMHFSLLLVWYLIYQGLSSNVPVMTLGRGIFSSPLALNQLIPLNVKSIWNSCSKKLNSTSHSKIFSRNSPVFTQAIHKYICDF